MNNTAYTGAVFYCGGGRFYIQDSDILFNRAFYSAEGFCTIDCRFSRKNVTYKNNFSEDTNYNCRP